jgi:hypothetical protein
MVTTLILILGGVLLAALVLIYFSLYEGGSPKNKSEARITRGSTKMLKSNRRAFAFQLALR